MAFDVAAAKSAGYTDQEINAYLQSKRVTTTPQMQAGATTPSVQQPKQPGFLSRLVKPTVEAFSGTARTLGTLGQVGTSSLMKPFAPQAAARVAGYQGPGVLRQEELREIEEDPGAAVGKQLKRSAIIGSYAVPFKAGMTGRQLFRAGALSGGLYGAGQEEATPESIAQTALLGGVVAWAAPQILGGIGKRLGKAGSKAREAVIRPQVKASPTFSQEQARLVGGAKRLGLKGSASQQAEQLATKYLQLSDELGTTVSGIQKPLNTNELVNKAVGTAKLQTNVSKGVGKANVDFLSQNLKSVSTWDDLLTYKFDLQKALHNVYRKLERGNPLSVTDKVTLVFHNTVDDALKTASPEVKNVLADMALTHQLAPGLLKATGERVNVPIPFLRATVGAGPLQGAKDITGRALQGAGGILEAFQRVASPEKFASAGARAPQFLQALFPQEQQPTEPATTIEEFKTQVDEVLAAETSVERVQQRPAITKEQVIAVLLNPDIKTATKNSIVQAYKLQGGDMTAQQKGQLSEAKNALNLVDIIDRNFAELQSLGLTAKKGGLGRLRGLKGTAAQITQEGRGGAAAAAYEDTKSALLSRLARATGERGVLTDYDLIRIKRALPKFSDTPETSSRKLQIVRDVIGGAIETYSDRTGEEDQLENIQPY